MFEIKMIVFRVFQSVGIRYLDENGKRRGGQYWEASLRGIKRALEEFLKLPRCLLVFYRPAWGDLTGRESIVIKRDEGKIEFLLPKRKT